MSELGGNYCVCTSLPVSYSPLHNTTMSSVNGLVCVSQVRNGEKELDTTSRMTQEMNGGRKSILYDLLNVGVSASPGSRQSDEDKEKMFDSSAKLFSLSSIDAATYRTRSDSFNSAASCGVVPLSRTSSGGSLASSVGGHVDREATGQSEALVEATLSRLVQLSTNGGPALLASANRSRSQPGTPPSPGLYPEVRRKYSMGSRTARMQPVIAELIPVDLSCKRSRYTDPTSSAVAVEHAGESSILKSILTVSSSRERSNTLSVCGTRGLARPTFRQQHVTLAKKTLLPVSARVSELLKRSIEFACSLPEFMSLACDDRRSLLACALPRLVVLYMAEKNLEFAVTPAHEDDNVAIDCDQMFPLRDRQADLPTQQFVEGLQNLIRKCQLLQISANEFFYMRMITLFHTGSSCSSLQQSDAIEQLATEARQDLQDFTKHHRPSERLRYSNLLLTLHTVFGVHCGMLAALFCRQLAGFTGNQTDFDVYAQRELSVSDASDRR